MPPLTQKNFRVLDDIVAVIDQLVAEAEKRGVTVKPSEICSAGIIAYLEADDDTRTRWLQRAKGFHFEKLRRAGQPASCPEPEKAAKELDAAARRAKRAPAGKPAKRRSG